YDIRADGEHVQDWTGSGYRLPTEAEWEYACRAGTETRFSFGNRDNLLAEYAWFAENSERTTHPAGRKRPNEWGIYDMHGNVWEWCWDWHGKDSYKQRSLNDPTGPATGIERVLRGGSFQGHSVYLRSAARVGIWRSDRYNSRGLRIARNYP